MYQKCHLSAERISGRPPVRMRLLPKPKSEILYVNTGGKGDRWVLNEVILT